MTHEVSNGKPSLIEEACKLSTSRQARDEGNRFLVHSVRDLVHAEAQGYHFERIIHCRLLLKSSPARELLQRFKRKTDIVRVRPELFRQLCPGQRASGIAAILKKKNPSLSNITASRGQVWICLTRIRSPGNFGSLIRTSAAAGASGFLLVGQSIDHYDPLVVRASMGSIYGQTIVRTRWPELSNWSRENDLQVIGASGDASESFVDFPYQRPMILMLGEERKGLNSQQRRICHSLVRIPTTTAVDSLNLSVAGAIILFEINRTMEKTS